MPFSLLNEIPSAIGTVCSPFGPFTVRVSLLYVNCTLLGTVIGFLPILDTINLLKSRD
jgi:hypothetical protein